MFFVGKYQVKVDGKGRIVLPANLKKMVVQSSSEGVILEKSPYEPCLQLSTMEEWQKKAMKIRESLNEFDPEEAQYMTRFFSDVEHVSVAENGRISLSQEMLKAASIENEVIVSGQFDRITIWSVETFEKSKMDDDEFKSLTKKLLGKSTTEKKD